MRRHVLTERAALYIALSKRKRLRTRSERERIRLETVVSTHPTSDRKAARCLIDQDEPPGVDRIRSAQSALTLFLLIVILLLILP
jgi:hypothetical protein